MKKTAVMVILAVLLLSGGPALASCPECERLLRLGLSEGYSESQIMKIASAGDPNAPVTHAQMERRLKRAIENKNSRSYSRPTQAQSGQGGPYFIAGSDKRFNYDRNEVIKVPSDIEGR